MFQFTLITFYVQLHCNHLHACNMIQAISVIYIYISVIALYRPILIQSKLVTVVAAASIRPTFFLYLNSTTISVSTEHQSFLQSLIELHVDCEEWRLGVNKRRGCCTFNKYHILSKSVISQNFLHIII